MPQPPRNMKGFRPSPARYANPMRGSKLKGLPCIKPGGRPACCAVSNFTPMPGPPMFCNELIRLGVVILAAYMSESGRASTIESVFLSNPTAKLPAVTCGGRSEEHTSELQSLRHLVC